MKSSLLARAALASALIGLAGSTAASETRCVRGDDAIRRVEIAAQSPGQNVPCEVVYWKDTEQPGVRKVLWSAETDADFCARKAEELVATLESGGWSCTAGGEPQSANRQAPPAAASPPQAAPSPLPQAAPSPSPQAAASPSPQAVASPPPQVAASPSPQAAPSPPPQVAANPPAEPESSGSDEAAPAYRAALSPQDGTAAGQGADEGAAGTALDTIIEQNLVRLNDGVDGRFAAEIAGYGDLDGDGLEDGVVFFTYESERLGTARFVAVYLFDGETYALAATKPLAGSEDKVHSTELETIENGVISVRLNVLEPGDASCCPSGLRRQALVLRSGQLLEASTASSAESRS
jgi:hypothetical protein